MRSHPRPGKAQGELESINESEKRGTFLAACECDGTPAPAGLVYGRNLTALLCLAKLTSVPRRTQKPAKRVRAPRIRVPNSERALFKANDSHFVGVIQRLSLTGGSAVLSKGPIPQGTMGDMTLNTVFGRVNAQIEFLQTGADGVPLAQAFRFLAMDDASTRRFTSAAEQMVEAGFSDAPEAEVTSLAPNLTQLLHSIRRLAATLIAAHSAAKS